MALYCLMIYSIMHFFQSIVHLTFYFLSNKIKILKKNYSKIQFKCHQLNAEKYQELKNWKMNMSSECKVILIYI